MSGNGASEGQQVLVKDEGGVRVISLNRPERLNALADQIMGELVHAVSAAAWDPEVGCVVLTGEGRGFCAGGDLKSSGARDAAGSAEAGGRFEQGYLRLRGYMESARLLHAMPKPTIAMINGPVAGAGIGLAGACDLRFAGESATFLSAFDRIGASGDFGSTWFWSKILGTGVAREIFLLGEKLTAQEAFAKGIYTRLLSDAELLPATMATARRLADGPRMGYRYMKANLNLAEDSSFETALDSEALNMGLSASASAAIFKARRAAEASV